MTDLILARDAVALVVDHLQQRADATGNDWWIGTEWTSQEVQVLVRRTGGAPVNLVVDRPQMLVECYGLTRRQSEQVGNRVQGWVGLLPGADVNVYRVEWLSGPVYYPDVNKRPRVQMSFYLRIRMQAQQEA